MGISIKAYTDGGIINGLVFQIGGGHKITMNY